MTGTSDKLAVEGQLELIRALQPEAKTIGILYTTSEPNSVSAIAEYEEKAPAYGFTIEAVGVTAQSEVAGLRYPAGPRCGLHEQPDR